MNIRRTERKIKERVHLTMAKEGENGSCAIVQHYNLYSSLIHLPLNIENTHDTRSRGIQCLENLSVLLIDSQSVKCQFGESPSESFLSTLRGRFWRSSNLQCGELAKGR